MQTSSVAPMNATSSSPASVRQLNSTFGVLFIGFMLAVSLYGLTFFQTYVFFAYCPKEHSWTKRTIGLLWMVDSVTTALISQIQYQYLITDFYLPFDELKVTRTLGFERILAAVVVCLVQGFYGVRAWQSTKNAPVLPAIIGFFAAASFGLGVVSTVQLSHRESIANLVDASLKITIAVQEGLSTICNVAIVGTMLACQQNVPQVVHIKKGEPALKRLVVNAVNRGTPFAIVQVVLLVTFLAMPHSQFWLLFHFVASKVYINTLLAMLNSRKASHSRGSHEGGNQSRTYSSKHSEEQLSSGIVFEHGRRRTGTISSLGTGSFDGFGSSEALTASGRSEKDTIGVIPEEYEDETRSLDEGVSDGNTKHLRAGST